MWFELSLSNTVAITVEISLCNAETDYLPLIVIFEECVGSYAKSCIDYDQGSCTSYGSSVVYFNPDPGETYWIEISGLSGACGHFLLDISQGF